MEETIVISQIVLIYKHRVFAGMFSLGAFKWVQLYKHEVVSLSVEAVFIFS